MPVAQPARNDTPTASVVSDATGWGEVKQATVLFADIVSSTEQIASLEPEEAMDRLRPAVTTMCIAVERFGGTVIRTLGDGLMALFGVPKSLEGHATLACEAALHMQAQFAGNPQGFSIRVGLHSGRVASDPHAADSTRGGGAHGLTIHLASRVIAMAPPGQITITADCHALAGPGCEVQSLGFPPLKGIPGRVEILLLKGLDRDERGNRRFRLANLTPLRGRETEIAALEALEREARQGRGNAVGITGAPGTGKSRLCFEFAQRCRDRGVPVFEVHAQLYGHATPLQPALELLRVFFFRLPPGADSAAARKLVSNRLDAAGLRDEVDVALVHDFLGLAGAESPVAHLNPQAKRARLLLIVRHLVEQMGGSHAILIVEDLHWLDDASEEFVSVLVDALAGTRILLLVNYRPSYRSPWGQTPHFKEMELGELSAADMDALVAQLLAPISTVPQVRQLVCRRAAGNPFFAEELVRTLGESKLLESSGAPAGGLDAIEKALPATVQAVVGARLDRVGEPEKTLLQMCAIIGKDIPLAVLEHVAAPLAAQIEKGLAGLGRAGLIVLADDGRSFTFRHPLIQEVAYNTQLKVRRNQVHSDVALAMEAYYREQLDEFAGLIAYHYEAAGRKTDAARHTSRAAKWVGSTNAGLAIRHWHKVRALLEHDTDSADNGGLKLMANSKIAWLGWRQGLNFDDVKPYIDEAMALAASAGSRWAELLLMVEGRILQAGGASADLYVERVERALSLFDQASDPGRTATLNAALSQAYGWAGRLQEALAANDIALGGIGRIHKDDHDFVGFSIEQWVMAMRGRLLTRLGRFEEALECLDRLLQMAATSIDPVIVQMPHYGYVELAAQLGDAGLAKTHLARAADIAEKHPSPYLRVFALNGEALLHAMQMEHAQAARVLGEALALVRDANVAKEFETEILANLAESHRCAGSPELAVAHSKEAVRLSRERSNRLPECRGLITWGRVLAAHPRLGSRGEGEALLAQARSLMRATGAGSYESGLFPPGPFKGSLAPAA
jgi:adenylate cyclase